MSYLDSGDDEKAENEALEAPRGVAAWHHFLQKML
jgi:hypothetical protein